MQYKKEAVRESILNAATEEFFEKGYSGASMRDICRRAGTSVGNLYRYFENREAVFSSVVGDMYEKVKYIIAEKNFGTHEFSCIRDIARFFGDQLFRNYRENAKKLLILLDKSEGSGYGDVKSHFSSLLAARVRKEKFPGEESKSVDFVCNMIAGGALEAIYNIMRNDFSPEESMDLFERVLVFYFNDYNFDKV